MRLFPPLLMGLLLLGAGVSSTGNLTPRGIEPAVPITPVLPCGMNITQDTYLEGDVLNCTQTAIRINADNVVLDCQGHRLTGRYEHSWPVGVHTPSAIRNNIEVRNCVFDGFWTAVRLSGTGHRIHGNRILNSDTGVYPGNNSQIYDNYFYGNMKSVILNNHYNEVRGNFMNRSGIGVLVGHEYDARYNNITGNSFTGGHTGVRAEVRARDNMIWNNGFFQNDMANAETYNNSLQDFWNLGTVGNYWDDWESNPGYPDIYYISYFYRGDPPGPEYSLEADFHPLSEPPGFSGGVFTSARGS